MRTIASISLLSFFIFIFLGVLVYIRNPKARLNKAFALFSALLCYYSFTQFMLRNSQSINNAYLWASLNKASLAFLTPAYLHLILIYTESLRRLKKIFLFLICSAIYLPALVASFIFTSTDLATTGPVKYIWGYEFGIAKDPQIFILLTLWAAGLTAIGAFFLNQYYLKTDNAKKKLQAKYMIIGIFLPAGVTIIILLFPAFHINEPYLTSIFLAGMLSIVAFVIIKYELFEVGPEKAAGNIIDTMSDALIVINENKNITFVNDAVISLFGYSKAELVNYPFIKILTNKELLARFKYPSFNENMITDNYEAEFKTKNNEKITVLFSSSFIRDNQGDVAGILIIVKDISEQKKAQEEIKRLTYQAAQDKANRQIFEFEAKLASEIQTSLLPKQSVITPELRIFALLRPAHLVGGDWYDYFPTDGKLAFSIGDASGKGVPAALLATFIMTSLANELKSGLSLATIINKVNDSTKNRFRREDFATLIFGTIAKDGSLVEYLVGGHELPLHYQVKTASWKLIKCPPGLPMGIKDRLSIRSQSLKLDRGDKLLMYSDGLYDIKNKNGQRLSLEEIQDWLQKNSELSSDKLITGLVDFAVEFGHGEVLDDIAVLIIKRV